MILFVISIVVAIVCVVIYRKGKSQVLPPQTAQEFTVYAPKSTAIVGVLCSFMTAGIAIVLNYTVLSDASGSINGTMKMEVYGFIALMLLGDLYLTASGLPAYNCIEVKGDHVQKKALVGSKEWTIQDIDRCELVVAEGKAPVTAMDVYLKGKDAKACSIRQGSTGYDLFQARMEQENIPVISKL